MADINLTTTAVTPTTTNLSTLRGRLRQELHDEDSGSYRWQDATLNRHLSRAVRELSLVLPLEQKTALTTTLGSHDVSVSSLSDLVRIEAVEYPTGQWPPGYVRFSLYGSTLTLLSTATPAAGEALNVFWGRLHSLDGSVSTLPTLAEDAVVTGAAGYAALEWASFATNRAKVTGAAAFDNYRALGEERLQQFRDALQAFGREARLGSAALYSPERAVSQSTVQWSG